MSIYDNETKSYPDLNPTAPQEPQTYRLKNRLKLRHYFLMKLKFVNGLPKKSKRFNTITGIVDTGLITLTVITGETSIATFASGVGLPVGIAYSATSLLLPGATIIIRKSVKIFTVKQEKHDSIKLLRQHS